MHSNDQVGAYYDESARAEGLARLYDAPTPLGEFYRDRIRRIERLLAGVEGDLLDAGCGTGQMLRHLGESRALDLKLTGLDRSASNLEVARRVVGDASDVRLVVGRIEELPFAAASFDVVLAMGSLEYVASLEAALAELARVTRPGGLALVTMQSRWSPYRLWETALWSRIRGREGSESPIVRRLRRRPFRRALTAAGFTPRGVVDYNFNVLPPPLDRRFPRVAIRLERALARTARGPLRLLAADYIVVARRAPDETVARESSTATLG